MEFNSKRYPVGHFVRALGPLGDKDTENEVLLLEHDVPHSKFSEEVLSFLPKLPWSITKEVSSKLLAMSSLGRLCVMFMQITIETLHA